MGSSCAKLCGNEAETINRKALDRFSHRLCAKICKSRLRALNISARGLLGLLGLCGRRSVHRIHLPSLIMDQCKHRIVKHCHWDFSSNIWWGCGLWIVSDCIRSSVKRQSIDKSNSWKIYKHRNNCESCKSQVTYKVKLKCQFCPVLSTMITMFTTTNMTTMTVATMMTIATMRKLEVIWGSWRFYRYTRKLKVIWKASHEWMNE